MARYKKYIDNTNRKAIREFRITMRELLVKLNKTKPEKQFIQYYYQKMPVGINPCIINRICWKIEEEFDNYNIKYNLPDNFDYSILKSNVEYSKRNYNEVQKQYEIYSQRIQEHQYNAKKDRLDEDEAMIQKDILKQTFKSECEAICPNEDELCDIVLDLCYPTNKSKFGI